MYKKISVILVIFGAIAAGIYFFMSRNYPVAFVNNRPIFNGDFYESYLISYNFYGNSLRTNNQDNVILKSDEVVKELKRATLDVLIGQKIIDEELEKRIKNEDLSNMVSEKISAIDLNSDNFKKGTQFLYGATAENVKNLVLIPKAKEEILQGRLILENSQAGNFDDWLKQKKSEAKVEILTPGFYWGKSEVQVN